MNRITIIVLPLCFMLLPSSRILGQVPGEAIERIHKALPESAPAKPKSARKLLVYSFTNGFRHGSIETGALAMQMMGKATGAFDVTHTEDSSFFEPDELDKFDAVLMLNTTGEVFRPKRQRRRRRDRDNAPTTTEEERETIRIREDRLKKSLVDFVTNGKGLAGFHAATDTYKNWSDFNEMMGGAFRSHPWSARSTVGIRVDDPTNVLTRVFQGRPFMITDEIYQFRDDTGDRSKQRVLLSLNPETTDLSIGTRANGDYPVAWVRDYGKGRVFYCSLGHNKEIYWNPEILHFYLAGLQFALGDLEGVETTPVPLR